MNTGQLLNYLDAQKQAIQTLIDQLNEVQVAFSAQFDEFRTSHDAVLDRLTVQVADRLDDISPGLRAAIEEQLPEERQSINERRHKVREQYLPQRQQAADDLVSKAQAELAELRTMNPQLDEREEDLKRQKTELETRLGTLNEEIRQLSRGLGVVRHFTTITKADRERQQIIGKLEIINDSLHQVRRLWEQEHEKTERFQAAYQEQWQLERIAVARLQSELDQLEDDNRREDLALRRAIRHVLDALKQPLPGSGSALDEELQKMIELNIQTDAYHEGLASVGGFIGLLRGIDGGLQAIRRSIEGLMREQQMHKDYLKALAFRLPPRLEAFNKQWATLAHQFADEKAIGTHPADFSASVKPLVEGPLSQANIETMFGDLSEMVKQATTQW